MAIKLFAVDMDGTFMIDNFKTSTQNILAAEKAIEAGCEFVIATGRSLGEIPPEIMNIKGIRYLVLSNGATIYDIKQDKPIFCDFIPNNEAYSIMSSEAAQSCFIMTFINGRMHFQKSMITSMQGYEMYDEIINFSKLGAICVDDIAQTVKDMGVDIAKIVLVFKDKSNKESVIKALDCLKNYDLANSYPLCLEINKKGINKAQGVGFIADMLGISHDEIVTIGDSGNDVAMLKMTKHSFAMENAMEIAKNAANYLAPKNTQNGVAAVINKFLE